MNLETVTGNYMKNTHDGATAHPKDGMVAFYVSAAEATPEIPAGAYVEDHDPWTLKQMVHCLQNISKTVLIDYDTLVEVSDIAEEFCMDALRSDGDNGYDAIIAEAERLGVFTDDGWVHDTTKGQAALLRMYEETQDAV
jgi:hypothetical protein